MKEKPVLFNAEMVRAILDGRKTQTRRIIKNQRVGDNWSVQPAKNPRVPSHTHDWWLPTGTQPYSALPRCPYGAVGDRLWVREKTKVIHILNDKKAFVAYLADGEEATVPVPDRLKPIKPGYCLSNGCYRDASRITLEITGVRVDRLQDISEADAFAEGVTPEPCDHARRSCDEIGCCGDTAKGEFVALWKSIYGAESWQANPWVWVIEFKRVEE